MRIDPRNNCRVAAEFTTQKGEGIGPVRGLMSLGMGFVRQATQEIELVNVPRSPLESLNETIPGEPHVPLTVPENGIGIRALGGQRSAVKSADGLAFRLALN